MAFNSPWSGWEWEIPAGEQGEFLMELSIGIWGFVGVLVRTPQDDPRGTKYSLKLLQNSKVSHKNLISQQFLFGATLWRSHPSWSILKTPKCSFILKIKLQIPPVPRTGGRWQAEILEHLLGFILCFIPGRKSSPGKSLSGFFPIIILCHIPKKKKKK